MSWVHVARKDFADASRSLVLWAVMAVMILLVVGMTALPSFLGIGTEDPSMAIYLLFTAGILVIPIVALLVGYNAVVGERESGSIRFLLGLPNTRRDVVLGKLLGRSAVVLVASIVAFAVGAAVMVWRYEEFLLGDYLLTFAFTVLMGVVYLSISIAISTSVPSRGWAIGGVLFVFVLLDLVWQSIAMGIYYLLEGGWPTLYGEGTLPAWFVLFERLAPGQALTELSAPLAKSIESADFDMTTAGRIAGEVPFYLETWFAGVIVLAWIVVPLALGYVRFSRASLA